MSKVAVIKTIRDPDRPEAHFLTLEALRSSLHLVVSSRTDWNIASVCLSKNQAIELIGLT